MKVLVVGQGGREHVLTWKLANSPSVEQVFCAPGNAGTADCATNLEIGDADIEKLVEFAKSEQIDLTVVGPEVPLVAGIVDAFLAADLTIFGPNKAAAQLEGSKAFSKKIMRLANVPTADFQVFDNTEAARYHIEAMDEQPVVIKADGLAAGKGVIVCANKAEAWEAIVSIMENKDFGEAGSKIVIEDFLEGQEASILAIVDGKTIIPLEPCQDHKPAFDGDKGPNTGGMGAYCPAPLVTNEMMDDIIEDILIPIVHTMNREDCPFRGVLYAGLMIGPQGPKVLEFNVRFGDPEAQPVFMRLKSDLAQILLAAANGKLDEIPDLEWDPRPAVCVVMASEGYPGSYSKGHPITGLAEADALPDVKVFHAGTKLENGQVVNSGGRVLGVTALGDNIADAKLHAYQAVKQIRWDGAWCRKDISDKARDLEILDDDSESVDNETA